ncbi:MAG: MarR family transcriptional regulator [Rhodospirillales bacterium]|nr:MarR family transcriptional regulator [Rhodospirillales bacterium]
MSVPEVHDKPGHLIRRCQQIAVALFLEGCAEFDLTPPQYAVLRVIEAEPGIDQATLGGLAALDRSSTARLCAALEARGLLRRAPDPADRRARRLSLTPEGTALLARAEPAVASVQEKLLAPLPPPQRQAFLTALHTLAAAHNALSRAPLREAAA